MRPVRYWISVSSSPWRLGRGSRLGRDLSAMIIDLLSFIFSRVHVYWVCSSSIA
jgi:hypothetical protein